jgi:hypothetical protein
MLERFEEQAGLDPLKDRYYAGYLAGINDFLKAEFEEAQ